MVKKSEVRQRRAFFRQNSIYCGGPLYDREICAVLGISRQTIWKYKKEAIRETRQRAGLE